LHYFYCEAFCTVQFSEVFSVYLSK
jgi:hypothetical protein